MPVSFQVLAVSADAGIAASAAVNAIHGAGGSVDQPVELNLDELPQHLAAVRRFHGVTVICGSDAILEPTRDQLDAERVGVAELYRHRLNAMIGPIAALAELACGPCGQGVLLAVPGGPDHVKVAIEELLLPLAPLLLQPLLFLHSASSTRPSEDPAAAIPRAGTSIDAEQIGSEPRSPLGHGQSGGGAGGSGWEAGLLALGGTLDRTAFPALPDRFKRLAPARNVLETAGERGLVTLPDGHHYTAFGFPDLLRPASKVLLVAEGEPLVEIIALHRFPRRVGIAVHRAPQANPGFLPDAGRDPKGPAIERTGSPCPSGDSGPGTLFAVDGSAIYVQRDRKVWSWDGRKERLEGTPAQVLASLLLRWSQR